MMTTMILKLKILIIIIYFLKYIIYLNGRFRFKNEQDLVRKVNHIIYQQSLIKRDEDDESKSKDEDNIKSLQDLRDVDLSYLSMNDKQIINIT